MQMLWHGMTDESLQGVKPDSPNHPNTLRGSMSGKLPGFTLRHSGKSRNPGLSRLSVTPAGAGVTELEDQFETL